VGAFPLYFFTFNFIKLVHGGIFSSFSLYITFLDFSVLFPFKACRDTQTTIRLDSHLFYYIFLYLTLLNLSTGAFSHSLAFTLKFLNFFVLFPFKACRDTQTTTRLDSHLFYYILLHLTLLNLSTGAFSHSLACTLKFLNFFVIFHFNACRETSIRLAGHFVRAPISRPGGHNFESPVWRELGALTIWKKILGVRPF
jgi:hypothetical protein